MSGSYPQKDSLDKVRDLGKELGRDLGERLKEIDPELLVAVASGNPYAVRNLRPAQAESSLPASVLAALERWNQSSWNNAFRDSSGWTNTWAQSPMPR
jgi:hypothetical protein